MGESHAGLQLRRIQDFLLLWLGRRAREREIKGSGGGGGGDKGGWREKNCSPRCNMLLVSG